MGRAIFCTVLVVLLVWGHTLAAIEFTVTWQSPETKEESLSCAAYARASEDFQKGYARGWNESLLEHRNGQTQTSDEVRQLIQAECSRSGRSLNVWVAAMHAMPAPDDADTDPEPAGR
jgi:hypothetical protein